MAENRIKKEYIKAKGDNEWIKVELYYSLGGLNCFTYKQEGRGYYLSAVPVKRENHGSFSSESFVAFTGVKTLVQECSRKGKTAEQKAMNQYEQRKAELLKHFADLLPQEATA